WNGLAIAALVQVAMQFDRPDWLAAAERAFAFVSERMTRDGDRLCHAARAGRLQTTDLLEDYAAMARAALALHEATGADRPLALAKEWVETVERLFLDPDQGGYFQTASDAPALIARVRQANDNATPSGNGQMGEVLARLWLLTGEEVYRRRAEALLRAFSGEARRNFLGLCTLTMALDLLTAAVQVVIIGQRGDPITQALIRAAYLAPEPLRVLQMIPPGAALSPRHPATGKAQIEGRATAYVCVGTTCSLPVTTAEALTALLRNQRLVS
ncbi:MAG: thioredoxin domain-containing protein, partial [Alphaproteobacteria bacterium]|nr:thioredoxin domain-containing protein [Alphaproteobacteria bacterium]